MARTNPYDIVVSPVDSGASFKRTKKVALDYTSVQNNYEEALAFVTSPTSNAYIGQYIYVHEASNIGGIDYTPGAYVVEGLKDAAKLTKLASGGNMDEALAAINEQIAGLGKDLDSLQVVGATPDAGYAAAYQLVLKGQGVDGADVPKGPKIQVPEVDIIEEGTEVRVATEEEATAYPGVVAGKQYLVFKFKGQEKLQFLNISDLVDVYTGSEFIEVSETNVISVKYNDLKAKLLADEQVGGVLNTHTSAITAIQDEIGSAGSAPDHADASGIYKIIIDNEEVTSAALNDLDDRLTKETGDLSNAKVDKTTTINSMSLTDNIELKTADIKLTAALEGLAKTAGEQSVQSALETMLALIKGNENALTWVVAE